MSIFGFQKKSQPSKREYREKVPLLNLSSSNCAVFVSVDPLPVIFISADTVNVSVHYHFAPSRLSFSVQIQRNATTVFKLVRVPAQMRLTGANAVVFVDDDDHEGK